MHAATNPYAEWILQNGERLAFLNPDYMESAARPALYKHWKPNNEWRNAELANVLLIQCHLFTLKASPWHGSPALFATIGAFFRRLEMRGHDHRWYHLEPGMGDRNTDRFTLVPLMEAFLLVRSLLDPALESALLARIKGALEVQFAEYGNQGKPFSRQYPNMDIYYCLIMLHGGRLTGDPKYQAAFERVLEHLAASQFEDGAWTYIKGTNESPGYHALVVILMGRIFDLTRHECAGRQLRKSIRYYPMTSTPGGVMESHTDCWWKHMWRNSLPSFAPDILASLTGDGQNRWLGDRVRPGTLSGLTPLLDPSTAEICNVAGLYLFYASLLWRDLAPEPVPRNRVLYDANIQGPRGHLDGWSWAATGRFGCDTVVGATIHAEPGEAIQALMAVTPEVPYYPPGQQRGLRANDRWDLAILPEGSKGCTKIDGEKAVFEISYQPACCRATSGAPAFPLHWRCDQRWEMESDRLVGQIDLTSLEDQSSPIPIVRIRFGEGHLLRQADQSTFTYGRFKVHVQSDDLPRHFTREAPVMISYTENDADELVFHRHEKPEEPVCCTAGQKISFRIQIDRLREPAGRSS